ncbi:MAG: hypothetical protein ABEK03_06315 [Candidatus Bipolaricaulia bacterium]
MAERRLTLDVRRYRPKRQRDHQSYRVIGKRYLRLRERDADSRRTLASLTPVPFVAPPETPSDDPGVLPSDRAKAWEELAQWICHFVIYADPTVQEGQYRNRLAWQAWAHRGADRPSDEDLYDWRRDDATLERLRPFYAATADRLGNAIGWPRRSDIAEVYPNPFEDEGLSDDARRLIRDLKAIFGPDIVRD